MLSLQLKSGEYLTIGDEIAVQIFEESGSTFRVAVKAPREIPILRGEVLERTGERPAARKAAQEPLRPGPGRPAPAGANRAAQPCRGGAETCRFRTGRRHPGAAEHPRPSG